MEEVWKPVVGFTGYEVSDLGNVRSYRCRNGRGSLEKESRLLKPTLFTGKLYVRCGLNDDNGIRRTLRGHVLVLETFVGSRPEGMQCCHRDDVQNNNVLSNLYWGTQAENDADKIRNGRQQRGSMITRATIDEVTAARIKAKLANDNVRGVVKRIAEEEGVTHDVVSQIKYNRTWKHVA